MFAPSRSTQRKSFLHSNIPFVVFSWLGSWLDLVSNFLVIIGTSFRNKNRTLAKTPEYVESVRTICQIEEKFHVALIRFHSAFPRDLVRNSCEITESLLDLPIATRTFWHSRRIQSQTRCGANGSDHIGIP